MSERRVGRSVHQGWATMPGVVAGAVLAVLLAGCGGTSHVKATTSAKSAGSGSSSGGTSAPASVWSQNAVAHRGQNGKTYALSCTSHGKAAAVWGTSIYTDDSSICSAAVQSGLISLAKGGTVTYQIAPGQDGYDGGVAHGVTSSSYAKWDGSFTFLAAPPGSISAGPQSWSQSVSAYQGQTGKQVTVVCSSHGTLGSVWGSGPYTDDSSVCTAAVFAGLITTANGGTVLVQITPGQNSYKGSTAHGVTTADYGSWGGSFALTPTTPST